MTAVPHARPLEPAAISDDAYVLPDHLTEGRTDRGPRFGDDVWDFRPFVPRTVRQTRCDFTTLPDEIAVVTAKEYLYSRLRRGMAGGQSGRKNDRPMKITNAVSALTKVKLVMRTLRRLGAPRLTDVTKEHLAAALAVWMSTSIETAHAGVNAVKQLSAHGPFLSRDRLTVLAWHGRSAKAVVGLRRDRETSTPRIPEHICAPFIKAALFYVEMASADLIAARREIEALQAARADSRRGPGEIEQRLTAFIEQRRTQGRAIPALPLQQAHTRPEAAIVNGVVQAPNQRLISLLAGVGNVIGPYRQLLEEAGAELGYEDGGLATPLSIWPDSGHPWRTPLDGWSIRLELSHLRTACWIVIAYLSGARDPEVRELGRECAFTEPGADGRLRRKLRGRVFKGRQVAGDEAEWVVLEPVHRAVEVLLELNDDPGHLFGYYGGKQAGYVLLSAMNQRLENFRDHANELFSTPDSLFIPNDVATGDQDGKNDEGMPWDFDTRQFRKTLAWHIAHQPFGIVAGARQYQHAKHTMFEGYAGTSASGFAAEVAAEEAVAKLDYLEDLYRDWNDGGRAGGGAAQRIDTEFDRIRRELGDLPGIVASPSRLRAMLQHLTKVLHPGVLNDCFYQPAAAVCSKRAQPLGRPLPQLNACAVCPNARRTAVHLPRLRTARDQARNALIRNNLPISPLPPLQQTVLIDFIDTFDRMIDELHTPEASA